VLISLWSILACFYVINISLVLSILVPSLLELLIGIHIWIICYRCIVFTRNMHFHSSCCTVLCKSNASDNR